MDTDHAVYVGQSQDQQEEEIGLRQKVMFANGRSPGKKIHKEDAPVCATGLEKDHV